MLRPGPPDRPPGSEQARRRALTRTWGSGCYRGATPPGSSPSRHDAITESLNTALLAARG